MADQSHDLAEDVIQSTSIEGDHPSTGDTSTGLSDGSEDIFPNENQRWEDEDVLLSSDNSAFLEPVQGGRVNMTPSRIGHRAGQGTLETVYIGMASGPMEFVIVLAVPPPPTQPGENVNRTIAHQCIDFYVNNSPEDLLRLLAPHFSSFAKAEMANPPANLQAYMERQYCFRLIPEGGDTVTFEPYPEFCLNLNGAPDRIDWDSLKDELANVPTFELSEIEDFRVGFNRGVYQVAIKGKNFLYKPASNTQCLAREISVLQKVAGCSLRVPKLEGVVNVNQKHSGMLLTLISNRFGLSFWPQIQPEVSVAERQKWYDQISDIIHALHQNDCCWGDAKPDNVVIDENLDAWLVDFEGGTTDGWVDPELANTVAGDLQGLERIREHLNLEE
ncbi:uncharacterized protein BO80DRAFT_438391 [Aspergillus ibericus CBS 121593]|uniref:Protein kinase domain-containing protein n=1 Tax=Aspergillus ibericus CBS 121593 TaxID=1448316 RepID=A0A395GM97_9EURO|nr:hypothetical protein BO80DRAFT_438391 [Aspergillus ibericus CBS 121593]RAK96599.1 hypothetical protein BO80DRAFT_438391 [Aspergillus ibericus CBS 121593]